MVTLDALQNLADKDELLMPVDSPMNEYPKVILSEQQGKNILLGRTIEIDSTINEVNVSTKENLVRIYQDQRFIGAGIQTNNKLSPKRLISL